MTQNTLIPFSQIKIGEEFSLTTNQESSRWIKKSSRTAYLKDTPSLWFYFSQKETFYVHTSTPITKNLTNHAN
jgi:hypothetical protein